MYINYNHCGGGVFHASNAHILVQSQSQRTPLPPLPFRSPCPSPQWCVGAIVFSRLMRLCNFFLYSSQHKPNAKQVNVCVCIFHTFAHRIDTRCVDV